MLIFDGIYKNGVKNGKVIEYYSYCNMKFEGEYLNGLKNGNGKEYYKNGKLMFEGYMIILKINTIN